MNETLVMEPFECSQPHFLGHFLKVPLIYGDPHFHTIEIDLESHSLEKDLRSDCFHSQPDPQLGMKPGNDNFIPGFDQKIITCTQSFKFS